MPKINIDEDWSMLSDLCYELNIEEKDKLNKPDDSVVFKRGRKINETKFDPTDMMTVYQPGVSTYNNMTYQNDGYNLMQEYKTNNINDDDYFYYNPDDYK